MDNLKKILKNKPKDVYVKEMFNVLASDYDFMNSIITFGRNKSFKKQAVKRIYNLLAGKKELRILDVCCGTGDIAIFAAEMFGESANITGVDFSEKMLEVAEKRAHSFKNIEFIPADVMNLPFENEYFDAVFISFGLRNLADIKKGLLEFKRVTKPAGYVTNLDVGKAGGVLGFLAGIYFSFIVPFMGKVFCGKAEPYEYLHESREDFPSQYELLEIMEELGYREIKNCNYMFGAVAQQVAQV